MHAMSHFRENMEAYKNALSWKKIAYGVVCAEKRGLAIAGGATKPRYGKNITRVEFLKSKQNSLKG